MWPSPDQTTSDTPVTVYTTLATVDELSMDRATMNEASRTRDSTTHAISMGTTRKRTVASFNTIITPNPYLSTKLLDVTSQKS